MTDIIKIDPKEYGLTDQTAKTIRMQFEPMLQKMDAEHPVHAHGRTPGSLGLGIVRLDNRRRFAPRNHLLHRRQKPLAAGRFPTLFKARCCKGLLRHGGAS